MAQNNSVYPVGLFYVGPSSESQTTILPIGADSVGKSGTAANQIRIKQENYADQAVQAYLQSCPTTSNSGKEKEVEDRNSETYWEKRKRFTLAFAAGLRKFIQMHPELLRYGPKKPQPGASATVTSSGAGEDGTSLLNAVLQCGKCDACQKTDDCGKCAFCTDMAKFGGKDELKKPCIRRQCTHAVELADLDGDLMPASKSGRGRSPRARRGRGGAASGRKNADDDDEDFVPSPRKRGRSTRQTRVSDGEQDEVDESSPSSFNYSDGLAIKTEPEEDFDD